MDRYRGINDNGPGSLILIFLTPPQFERSPADSEEFLSQKQEDEKQERNEASLRSSEGAHTLTGTMAGTATIGQRLDAFVAAAQANTDGSAALFVLVIGISVSFSFFLLNSGSGSAVSVEMTKGGAQLPTCKSKGNRAARQKPRSPEDPPEPNWNALKLTNCVAATGFLLSVLKFASNASAYLNDSTSLLQFLSIWSVFLLYFFGFFGIALVDLDDLVEEQPSPAAKPQPSSPSKKSAVKTVDVER